MWGLVTLDSLGLSVENRLRGPPEKNSNPSKSSDKLREDGWRIATRGSEVRHDKRHLCASDNLPSFVFAQSRLPTKIDLTAHA